MEQLSAQHISILELSQHFCFFKAWAANYQ